MPNKFSTCVWCHQLSLTQTNFFQHSAYPNDILRPIRSHTKHKKGNIVQFTNSKKGNCNHDNCRIRNFTFYTLNRLRNMSLSHGSPQHSIYKEEKIHYYKCI